LQLWQTEKTAGIFAKQVPLGTLVKAGVIVNQLNWSEVCDCTASTRKRRSAESSR
jgi:hypothetical protein